MELGNVVSTANLAARTAQVDAVRTPEQKPLERLQKNVESTKVQLSALGQVKSATAQVETAANALQDKTRLSNAGDVQKAVQNFANAVNSQQNTVRQTVRNDNRSEPGALANEARVRASTQETRRAVQGPTGGNEAALRQIGVTFSAQGEVRVDSKKLEQAFQANPNQVTETLNRVGKETAEVSRKQLSDSGAVGGSINRLNERLGSLQQNQNDYQAQLRAAQQAIDRRNLQIEQGRAQTQQAVGLSGSNAYRGVLST